MLSSPIHLIGTMNPADQSGNSSSNRNDRPPGYNDPNYIGLEYSTKVENREPSDVFSVERQVVWMNKPSPSFDCPPGLEYLCQLDQFIVEQKIEMMEMITGYETNNRYSIKNTNGQQIYFAKEETDFCIRNCCGPHRPFTIRIEDNTGFEVLQIIRPYKCTFYGQCLSCSACCKDEVEIQASNGEVMGFVRQLYEGCRSRYAILNPLREMVLKLHGPLYCHCHCPGDDIPFMLMSSDGITEVGIVSKTWSNLFKEWFTDADNFGIKFPMDLDVRIKSVILGAVFLIDFMYFESSGNNRAN